MRIQKQLSKKRKNKIYYKYAVVIPPRYVKESGLEGYELEAEVNKGEIKLRKKEQEKQVKNSLKDVKARRIKRVA
jgi:antitoxin component of MazEF toxin-antitoxin module